MKAERERARALGGRATATREAERLLANGERRLRALLDELEVRVIAPTTWRALDPDGATLRDVYVPADLPG